MFLTETHMHTVPGSPCAKVMPEDAVESYIDSGYSTIVITNHFCRDCRNIYRLDDDKEWIDHFLLGYRNAHIAAKGRIHVLLGMEIRFDENANDYLVYGPTADDLYAIPDMYSWKLGQFHQYAALHGWMILQAHPFRNGMSVIASDQVDGIEVFNGNPRHDSRNDIAVGWANKFQLLRTAGSDFHQPEDLARGGLLTTTPITTIEELQQAIRNGAGLYRAADR